MILTTKRLILRPWRESDAAELYKHASDADIGLNAGWPPHTSVQNSREIIKNVLSVPLCFAVCLRDDDRAIGSISIKTGEATDLTSSDHECELGFWIGKDFWGQGLMPEAVTEILRYAFQNLQMNAVYCGYYDGNERSRRAQEKCGFIYHHTEESVKVALLGEYRTVHISLLTKEDYENIKEAKI